MRAARRDGMGDTAPNDGGFGGGRGVPHLALPAHVATLVLGVAGTLLAAGALGATTSPAARLARRARKDPVLALAAPTRR